MHRSLAMTLWPVFLAAGCTFETPYVGWPTPAPPAAPMWVREVIEMVRAGTAEDAILDKAREVGIAARPTRTEIRALKEAGASDQLIVAITSAALLEPPECPPMPTIEFQFTLWQPFPLLPGGVPIPVWLWLEGRGQSVPRPERIEP